MKPLAICSLFALLLCCTPRASANPSLPAADATSTTAVDDAITPIRSRGELALHLATHAPFLGDATENRSPFSPLPDRARQRFVQSLRFHPDHGMVGGTLGMLTRDLTRDQATALLRLLDSYVAADAINGWRAQISIGPTDPLAEPPVPSRHEQVFDGLQAMYDADGWWTKSAPHRLALMQSHAAAVLFDPAQAAAVLPGLRNTELDWLWEITNLIGLHANDARSVDMSVAVFDELVARKLVQPRQVVNMFGSLVAARRFQSARDLSAGHPQVTLAKVPQVIGVDPALHAAVVYRVHGEDVLEAEVVDLSRGRHVVGMVSPTCGFARELLDHLAAHPELLDGVSTLWIDTVNRKLDLSALLEWSRAHPALAIALPHAASDWPFVEEMATPQLWLLDDGEVIGTSHRWDEYGPARLDGLLAAARQLSASSAPD